MRPNGRHRQITGLRPGQFIHSVPSGRRAGPRRRRALALTLGVLIAGAGVAGAAGPSQAGASASAPVAASVPHGKSAAAADPRAAAAPAAPIVLFSEDFENNPNNTTPVLLNEYVGASGETYTADVTLCTPPGSTGTPGPAAWNDVRNLAYAWAW